MIYIHCLRNGGDFYAGYEGMDQSTIEALLIELNGTNIEIISEQDYLTAVQR